MKKTEYIQLSNLTVTNRELAKHNVKKESLKDMNKEEIRGLVKDIEQKRHQNQLKGVAVASLIATSVFISPTLKHVQQTNEPISIANVIEWGADEDLWINKVDNWIKETLPIHDVIATKELNDKVMEFATRTNEETEVAFKSEKIEKAITINDLMVDFDKIYAESQAEFKQTKQNYEKIVEYFQER